ncbi:MAG: Gfo/Idh/MocA family oxidoreductase [Pseudoxanthomonas sp.]
MRVLVTGRGSIAQRHILHLRRCVSSLELAVVASAGQVDASMQRCTILRDFNHGLAWEPDAVVIASASVRHADEFEACLRGGLPCLAEKPLAVSRRQLARLTALAPTAVRGNAVVVGCNLRYLPALDRMAQALRDGRVGTLMRAGFEVGQDLRDWRPHRGTDLGYSGRAGEGGGVVFDLVHEIDLARWILGPLQVRAAVGGHRSTLPIDSDDVHVALLQSAAGVPVVVSLDYVSRPASRRHVLVGEAGTLVCDLMSRQLTLGGAGGIVQLAGDSDFDVAATYHAQMQDWLASIHDPAHRVKSPLHDGLATATLMLDMKEAV